MKKLFKKISYTHRITLAILLFTLFPCILFGSVYLKNATLDWKKDILKNYQNYTDSTAFLMSKTITEFQAKMQHLRNNYQFQSYLSRIDELSIPQALDMIVTTNETVASISVGNSDLAVRWYPHKSKLSYGNYCYTLDRFAEEFSNGIQDPCYKEILALKENEYLWKIRNIARGGNNKGPSVERLCLYSQTTDLYGSSCILEFSIPVASLHSPSNSFISITDSLSAICLNQSGSPLNIILSTTLKTEECEELLKQYHEKKEVINYEIIQTEISSTENIEAIYLIPKPYVSALIYPKIFSFIGIALVLILCIISVCYITSYFLTKKIGSALNTLTTDLDHILSEPVSINYKQDDEIGKIVQKVQQLIQNTQEYCLQIEHYESENLRKELELLQMRFNPHLLYNTLDAINYQIKSPQARNTIESLCSYYRIVLNNGYTIIRIEDEINMIKKYLSIVKFTYGLDNVSYEFYIEDSVKQYMIIKHLLQPIVENALNHGIRPTGRGGTLQVLAYESGSDINIVIKDDGIGMEAQKAASLIEAPSASVYGGGYGIYNVQQRIQVYYGKEYGLEIKSSPEGTTVVMKIPKKLADK